MTRLFRLITSPSGLLYIFVVITQVGTGAYGASGVEESAGFTFLYFLAFLWIVGWWLRDDSKNRGFKWVYDLGFFLFVAWPFVIVYYLLKSRGPRGLLLILLFLTVYSVAAIAGFLMYALLAPEDWPHAIFPA